MTEFQIFIKEKNVCDFIKNDKVIAKYIYKGTWLSGSSTIVYPITVWKNDIHIQLEHNARSNYFKGFIKRIKKTFGLTAIFVKSDGSCADIIYIYK